ncbi:MAG TPA: lipoprotein insertase outer membrane protein LolB [Burkholderiaceae bacterium]|nr:lipoprotein insertase outer membrane protein LolB [Burkholderiaceae bacterium]
MVNAPSRTALRVRGLRMLGALIATFFIAACANVKSAGALKDEDAPYWSGRISISTTQPKPQRMTASFELSGTPEAGMLTLTSPLGTTLATARWSPGLAELEQGGQRMRYPDIQSLITTALSQPLPLEMVFAWLNGQDPSTNGWTADLKDLPQGRLGAHRSDAQGDADVRIVLDTVAR